MKKVAILFIFTAIIACNKNATQETKNNKVLWAENVRSILPLEGDTTKNETNLNAIHRCDKEKIFSSITHAVLSGKLKAYVEYPGIELTVKEFNDILVYWDESHVIEDPNNPGAVIHAPIKHEITSHDITKLKFNETIELDTISYTLFKQISTVTFFISQNYYDRGGYYDRKIFEVKLNDLSKNLKE